MTLRALENIRHSGITYKPGDVLKGLSKKDSERLISLRSAEEVETYAEVKEIVPDLDFDPVLFKELRDDLDANYNADELKRVAKSAGVEFDNSDTKEKVMEAIIKQGKVELLLEDGE